MVGSYHVRIAQRRRLSFDFTIRRNITLVGGDSGTGKTTLFNLVAAHMREGDHSGVTIQCDCACVALTDLDWQHQLAGISNSIVFIDEGMRFVESEDFARAVLKSSNYYVLFTRTDLPNLPFSINEIYEIKTSGKRHSFVPMYPQRDGFRYSLSSAAPKRDFDVLLTEDSKSGLEFFEARFADGRVACASGGNNAGLVAWLNDHADQHVFAIADGAAFGAYAQRVLRLQENHRDTMAICLPESFEWLLLASGLLHSDVVDKALEDPSAQVDSVAFSSWEQFFTQLLKQEAAGTPFAYRKNALPDAFKVPKNADKVMALIACRNIC